MSSLTPSLHRTLLLTPVLAALIVLSGCQNDDPSTPSQSAPIANRAGFKGEFNTNKAMDSQFNNHNQQFGWLWPQAQLRPLPSDKEKQWLNDWNGDDLALNPQAFYLLDTAHAVILADAQALGEDGTPDTSPSNPGLIVALYFHNENGQWTLDGTPIGITATGSSGYAGDI